MKYYFCIVAALIGFILTSCDHKSHKAFDVVTLAPPPLHEYQKGFQPDSSDLYANIKFDAKKMTNVFPTGFKAADLTDREQNSVDSVIKIAVVDYNREAKTKRWSQLGGLKHYRRQLVTAIDSNGVKHVFVNGFTYWPSSESTWKKQLFSVNDGGAGCFQLYINLKIIKCYRFNVNGEA